MNLPPPAGGFGAPQAPSPFGAPQAPLPGPPRSGVSVLAIVLAVVGGVVVIVGILAVLAISGMRKYLANAKTAEAKNTLGQIARQTASAYEMEGMTDDNVVSHHLCASATAPVPADERLVSGRKYMSTSEDWERDRATNAGFFCLKFAMMSPQYYQYSYTQSGQGFTATARGDLDGDQEFSRFAVTGEIRDGALNLSTSIAEQNPQE